MQGGFFDVSQEFIAKPVCFNHVWIEGVFDVVFARDVLEVRVECFKPFEEFLKPKVGIAIVHVVPYLAVRIRSAKM